MAGAELHPQAEYLRIRCRHAELVSAASTAQRVRALALIATDGVSQYLQSGQRAPGGC
jgi:hypothetical protein